MDDHLQRIQEFLQSGRATETLTACQEALSSDPARVSYWMCLGAAFVAADRCEEGILAFDRVCQLRPELPAAWYNLGLAMERSGQVQKALEHYRRALGLQPNYLLAQQAETRAKARQAASARRPLPPSEDENPFVSRRQRTARLHLVDREARLWYNLLRQLLLVVSHDSSVVENGKRPGAKG